MNGAGDEIRTRDIYLGKVVLYQLSYSRNRKTPALTDFSGTLRSEYHRRCRVSRPCSAWRGVVPRRCGHGGNCVVMEKQRGTSEGGVRGQRPSRGGGMGEGWQGEVKTSSDEHQSAEHVAGLTHLAS